MKCRWVNLNNEKYINYHDYEWGIPSYDDNYLFEMLVLESFQAGLSWECILNKREAFKKTFDNFDYNKISNYDDYKINELLNNKDIIKNKLKIEATINNAKVFIQIKKEYHIFANYIWKFTNNQIIKNKDNKFKTSSSLSDTISNDLKKRGMKFVGTTIIYSYLQAIGIIDDHELECDNYNKSILDKLSKSKFRNSFKLKEKDINYINEKGLDVIKEHAYDFINKRLAPKYIPNDGKQTPMKGHPVFIAQHVTAICCRSCLYKWHNIKNNKQLSNQEIDYIVNLIMAWIKKSI